MGDGRETKGGRAAFQPHTDGDHLPGADASELVKPAGRDGRACGTPLRRWGRALFVRPIGRGCRCDGKSGPAVWSVLFCHPGERLHKKTVVSRFLDSDGVGARPRQARPGRPGGFARTQTRPCRALTALLYQEDAELVGFADLRNIPNAVLPIGISVAIPLPAQIIETVKNILDC